MTGAVELMRELIAHRTDDRTDSVLERFGVADLDARFHCGMGEIDADGRFYQPVDGGLPAIVVPVMDGFELIDLLAFDPRAPDRWRLRLGAAALLGSDALDNQLLGKPLNIYRTPLAWLRAGLDGVVILDFGGAFVDLATAPNGLVAEDPQHQRELRAAMTEGATRHLPRIAVRSVGREAAA